MRKVCPSCVGDGFTDDGYDHGLCSLCDGQGYVRGDLDLRKIKPWTPGERFVLHAAAIIAICLLVMIWVTS